jgi:hypothetical protein
VVRGRNRGRPYEPVKGERYPDLILRDQNGDAVRLSDFAGKVILLELAAVPCKGCQAFAGGQERGGFAGVPVQRGLDSRISYSSTTPAGITPKTTCTRICSQPWAEWSSRSMLNEVSKACLKEAQMRLDQSD